MVVDSHVISAMARAQGGPPAVKTRVFSVGGPLVVSTPLKNMKVSWDEYSQYMEKWNSCSKAPTRLVHTSCLSKQSIVIDPWTNASSFPVTPSHLMLLSDGYSAPFSWDGSTKRAPSLSLEWHLGTTWQCAADMKWFMNPLNYRII